MLAPAALAFAALTIFGAGSTADAATGKAASAKAGPAKKASHPTKATPAKKAATAKKASVAKAAAAEPAPLPAPSEMAARVLRWIGKTDDNGKLPYIIVDKQNASMQVFDADGKPLGRAPVLVGIATGDTSSPGVGTKKLAELGPAEKTTPAGRFVAKFGYASAHEKVLWVDYADSVAMHAVITGNKKERRLQRINSPTSADNRITFGCINVPTKFYAKIVRPLFLKTGGVIYVLPDTKPVEDVFPALHAEAFL